MINKPAYVKLLEQSKLSRHNSIKDLFARNPNRADDMSLEFNNVYFDFSKNNITEEIFTNLVDLAYESDLLEQINLMFSGAKINNTENRSVLHTALRNMDSSISVDDVNVSDNIKNVLKQMQVFSEKLHNGQHLGYNGKKITDIVNIGIGGSDLGPFLAIQALKPYRRDGLKVHFISTVDGYQINNVLENLNPETTLFIIASKTFTTQETMTNANTAKNWFLNYTNKNTLAIEKHFVAVSVNIKAVTEFGINPNNMFQFWDFVGGRYSLCSAIGLCVILYIGFENFQNLLDGFKAMDEHFYETTDLRKNLPVVLALVSIWHINFCDFDTQVISPYSNRLSSFPAYVQQLEMESNGKSVDKDGNPITYNTCPIIWGGDGINGQHAYYQLLHQGTIINPMDIIMVLSDKFSDKAHNDILAANAIAQAEAFMCGKSYDVVKAELINSGISEDIASNLAKHKIFPGNRPTNTIVLPELSPYYLGMLIALYEHKVFVQGIIWNINSFDQMGVELGKQLAKVILSEIKQGSTNDSHDSSTEALIKYFINKSKS